MRRLACRLPGAFLALATTAAVAQSPAPEGPAPATRAPGTTAPEASAPQTPAPQTPAPVPPAPELPAPEAPAPESPAPVDPAPELPAPDMPAPEMPAPPTSAPVTSTPDTSASEVAAPQPAAAEPAAPEAAETLLPVERLTAEGAGSVNTYLVDVGNGVILVDAQRTPPMGRAVARRALETGEPVVAVLVTHPHPDHIGGLQAVVDATQARIYASPDTAVEIGADTRKLLSLSPGDMADAPPPRPPTPNTLVNDGDRLTLGSVEFDVIEFGPSEASSMTVYAVPAANAVFTGDLLSPGMTPFMLEKRTAAWLEQLDTLAERFPPETIAYPGHGAPGPLGELVAEQRAYLEGFRERVQAALADGQVSAAEMDGIIAATEAAHPGYLPVAELPELMRRNVIAVAAELSGDTGAPPLATITTTP